jgi:mannose-6-phosphate isomerase-like protein (cupin superfamily)
MYSVTRADAKVLDMPARVINILVGSEKLSSDRMTVGFTEVHPNTAMAPHAHEDMEEIIFVIEGHGEADVGGSIEKLEPDTAVVFPMGVTHAVTNLGSDPLKFVFIFNPPNDFSAVK